MLRKLMQWFGRKLLASPALSDPNEAPHKPTLQHILQQFQECADLTHHRLPHLDVDLVYFSHLAGVLELKRDVTDPLERIDPSEVQALMERSQYSPMTDSKETVHAILSGCVAIFHRGRTYVVNVFHAEARSIEQSETESIILGPHDAFVESLETNLSLVRRRIKSSHLKVVKLSVGEVTKTSVCVCYIDDIANPDIVTEFVSRIRDIETDTIHDGNMLSQYIDDAPNSLFPLFMSSERVDSVVSYLVAGRVVAIMDNSPSVLTGPSTFFDFFSSPDDYYHRWPIATAVRILRYIAFTITIILTSLYVSVTTFHYEMIPESLLGTLSQSRSRVPFPPVYEALMMETTIELLREAGARLPTKIGQTIGIVGGIVIGQAAVQAGFTSNVLIIAVALSAISSFVIPSYAMSGSIRFIRFGLIMLAGFLGNLGLVIGLTMIVIHLSGLTSLKASYLNPVVPFRFMDWKDVFIRGPFSLFKNRPTLAQTRNRTRTRIKR